jgi:cytochrome c biogenesis protein CcmG/thiol:disulfide interchange protein DsbE
MSEPTAAATTEPSSAPNRRRRVLIAVGGVVVVAALVVSVVSALSASNGKGASPVHSALVGKSAPGLAGETVTGGHASLAAYRGRWVIVNFFASWCVPCQKETPELVRFAAAHRGPHDPAILGVVYQDDDGSVRSFIHDHGVTWPLLAYRTIGQAAAYGVAGIPVTFLVSPDGRVATKALGGLRAGQLDTLLANAQAQTATSTTATAGP